MKLFSILFLIVLVEFITIFEMVYPTPQEVDNRYLTFESYYWYNE